MRKHQVIRALQPGDMARVKDVIDACGLFPSVLLEGMTAKYFTGETPMERWLTCDDNGPVAIAYYAPERMTQGTWNLLLIAVHPLFQGRGIGRAIMERVERELTTSGQRVLLVETSGLPDFENTRAFYKKLGYDKEATIREFYQAGEDKVIFRKALSP